MVACTPHPGYGTVAIRSGALVRHVDLATCRAWTAKAKPARVSLPTLKVETTGSTQQIRFRGRPVYTVHERYDRIPAGAPGPIELFGMSPDRRWVLFAIDPQGSASLAADGLTLQAVSVDGGRPHRIAAGLLAPDYRAWCDGKLVLTAGGDRIAGHHKWLVVTSPPRWRARRVLTARGFAFGALACRGNGVVVQATPDTTSLNPRWELWRVGLEGGMGVVDRPPAGWSDDSPRVGRDGTIVFVRSHAGRGTLFGLHAGALLGVGRDDGYYGHRPWAAVSWSR